MAHTDTQRGDIKTEGMARVVLIASSSVLLITVAWMIFELVKMF